MALRLPAGEDRVIQAFLRFHRENPHVYERLRELALQVRHSGETRWAIGNLVEVLRWETALFQTDAADGYKINNNHCALYARMLMLNEPALRGFFEVRTRRALPDYHEEV